MPLSGVLIAALQFTVGLDAPPTNPVPIDWTQVDQAPEEHFRAFAHQRTVQHSTPDEPWRIADWYSVNLDDEADLERVAVLCGTHKGAFLVEKGTRAWEIAFAIDEQTAPCDSVPDRVPVWMMRQEQSIKHQHGPTGHAFETWFALRRGVPAVIRTRVHGSGGGKRASHRASHDYDAQAHRRKNAKWPPVECRRPVAAHGRKAKAPACPYGPFTLTEIIDGSAEPPVTE